MSLVLTRRAALVGAFASAAFALPSASPGFSAAEDGSATYCNLQHWLDTAPPAEVAEYHADQLARALQKVHGGGWRGVINNDTRLAVVMRDSSLATHTIQIEQVTT
jgi:hypothetical protein